MEIERWNGSNRDKDKIISLMKTVFGFMKKIHREIQ